jgi:hypothetical protein
MPIVREEEEKKTVNKKLDLLKEKNICQALRCMKKKTFLLYIT